MPHRRLEVVPAEDRVGIGDKDLPAVARSPSLHRHNRGLRIVDRPAGSCHRVLHPKSPSAAWPSISRTSTGAPTCSLIFPASVGPIEGMRARSFGFAFWRSLRVLNPRWNIA